MPERRLTAGGRLKANVPCFSQEPARHTSRADPLVRAGRPRPALFPKHQVSDICEEPAGGPAADQGVRLTTYAGVSWIQKYAPAG